MLRSLMIVATLALAIPSVTGPIRAVAPLRVFSSNGVKALMEDVKPALERAAGQPVAFEFSTATALTRRVDGGDVPDVAILTAPIVDDLVTRGRLAAGTRLDVARVGAGVGVRTGAPPADISTPDAFKALLTRARSITFTAEGQSRSTIDAAFATLGIADAMRAKTILKGPGEAPAAVARGEAEVVLTLVSEMVEVPGLTLLGPFPAALQQFVTFSAARGAQVGDSAAADRVLRFLGSAEVGGHLTKHGLESASR
jgi:molybdate transport system substrate-binding protein